MEHKHEPYTTSGGIIRCRTCTELLSGATEEIAKVSSATRARRILEEVAVAGKYYALSWAKGFVIYARDKDGMREEITAEKLGDREYRIYRRMISKGGDV